MTVRPVITEEQAVEILDWMVKHKGRYKSVSEIMREAIDDWLKKKKLEETHFTVRSENQIEIP